MELSTNLTAEQWQAIDRGEAVRVHADGRDLVLVPAAAFERLCRDHDGVPVRDTYAASLKAWGPDPGAEVYRDLKGK